MFDKIITTNSDVISLNKHHKQNMCQLYFVKYYYIYFVANYTFAF